jgi:hypothetical protein
MFVRRALRPRRITQLHRRQHLEFLTVEVAGIPMTTLYLPRGYHRTITHHLFHHAVNDSQVVMGDFNIPTLHRQTHPLHTFFAAA